MDLEKWTYDTVHRILEAYPPERRDDPEVIRFARILASNARDTIDEYYNDREDKE